MDRGEAQGFEWDGVTRAETLCDAEVRVRREIDECARRHDWPRVLELLAENRSRVNAVSPDDPSWMTPLHHAARDGAEVEVVHALIDLGAFRTQTDSQGNRAVDTARARSRSRLVQILEPVYERQVPDAVLKAIERNFHELINKRAGSWVEEHQLRLPELAPLLEFKQCSFWFVIPGMSGRFGYWLVEDGVKAKLMTESFSRLAQGSGQMHEITAEATRLLEDGFV